MLTNKVKRTCSAAFLLFFFYVPCITVLSFVLLRACKVFLIPLNYDATITIIKKNRHYRGLFHSRRASIESKLFFSPSPFKWVRDLRRCNVSEALFRVSELPQPLSLTLFSKCNCFLQWKKRNWKKKNIGVAAAAHHFISYDQKKKKHSFFFKGSYVYMQNDVRRLCCVLRMGEKNSHQHFLLSSFFFFYFKAGKRVGFFFFWHLQQHDK